MWRAHGAKCANCSARRDTLRRARCAALRYTRRCGRAVCAVPCCAPLLTLILTPHTNKMSASLCLQGRARDRRREAELCKNDLCCCALTCTGQDMMGYDATTSQDQSLLSLNNNELGVAWGGGLLFYGDSSSVQQQQCVHQLLPLCHSCLPSRLHTNYICAELASNPNTQYNTFRFNIHTHTCVSSDSFNNRRKVRKAVPTLSRRQNDDEANNTTHFAVPSSMLHGQ